jgi:hypothetical protein
VGFTIVQAAYRREPTVFEKFLRSQDLVGETFKKEARLDVIGEDEANDKRLIEGIMELVS